MPNQVYPMPSLTMNTFAVLSDEVGGFGLAAKSLGMTCIRNMGWMANPRSQTLPQLKINCDCLAITMPSSARVFGADAADGSWIGGEAIANSIAGLVDSMQPKTLFIYARRALLTDRFGTTFGQILNALRNYSVAWKEINLSWFDIPQDANRVVVLGKIRDEVDVEAAQWLNIVRDNLPPSSLAKFVMRPPEELAALIDSRTPRLGKPAPILANPYGSGGCCISGAISSANYPIVKKRAAASLLGESLQFAWDLECQPTIHSVRFTSRRGVKALTFKRDGLSHSYGPSISAWPMFAVKAGVLARLQNKAAIVEWQTTVNDHDVFRLSPAASLGLFGAETIQLKENLESVGGGSTRKHEVGSSTVPARIAQESLSLLNRHLITDCSTRDFDL